VRNFNPCWTSGRSSAVELVTTTILKNGNPPSAAKVDYGLQCLDKMARQGGFAVPAQGHMAHLQQVIRQVGVTRPLPQTARGGQSKSPTQFGGHSHHIKVWDARRLARSISQYKHWKVHFTIGFTLTPMDNPPARGEITR
jgi:hypothetical protein